MNQKIESFESIAPHLIPSASHLAAESYYDNPAHIFLAPHEATRINQLEWLLRVNMQMQLKYGAESFCYPENGVVKAMGFWTRPFSKPISTITKVKSGLLKVPFKMGLNGFKRVMTASAGIDDHLLRSIPSHIDILYLNNMVIEESRRSKGWGGRILTHQFEIIKAKYGSATLALSTQRYWTVRFYERLGFEVVLEDKIGSGSLAFVNWTMKKELD